MSPKVQHIPPSGHLSTASLALLMAGQSLTTQYLSGVDIRGLVLADIAASCCWSSSAGRVSCVS